MEAAIPVPRLLMGGLALVLFAAAPVEAFANGFHCRLGQYWRPSLHVCQNHPYSSADRLARTTDGLEAPRGRAGHPVVSTDTRVIPGGRVVTQGHVVLRYLVQTSVVERY